MNPNAPSELIKKFLTFLKPQIETPTEVDPEAQTVVVKSTAPFCGNCKTGCIHCEGHIGTRTIEALKQICFGVVTKIEALVETKKPVRRKKTLEQLTKEFSAACLEKDWAKMEKINMQILEMVKNSKT